MIDRDLYWSTGPVRVRASAPDPFCGLRGHAYIAARGLGKSAARLPAGDDTARAAARENLIKAINQRPALPGEGNTSGHADGMPACTGAPRIRTFVIGCDTRELRDHLSASLEAGQEGIGILTLQAQLLSLLAIERARSQ